MRKNTHLRATLVFMTDLRDVVASAETGEFVTLLTGAEWRELAGKGRLRHLPRGAHLLFEGAQSDVVFVVLSGRVKVFSATSEGDEIVLAVRGPGALLGDLAAIDDEPRSASVVALEPVEALTVPAATFREYLLAQPRVTLILMRTLTARLREADRRRLEFGSLDTLTRVAARLVELADRFGAAEGDGVRITLSLTQEDLASWVGASREAVVKALGTLRSRGWITTERRSVVIRDLAALRLRSQAR